MFISWCGEKIKKDQLFSVSCNKISRFQKGVQKCFQGQANLESLGPRGELPSCGKQGHNISSYVRNRNK